MSALRLGSERQEREIETPEPMRGTLPYTENPTIPLGTTTRQVITS